LGQKEEINEEKGGKPGKTRKNHEKNMKKGEKEGTRYIKEVPVNLAFKVPVQRILKLSAEISPRPVGAAEP
jgi:hypothetical protein